MKLSESMELLNDLGLADWLSKDLEASTRLIVNAVVGELLDSQDPYELRPYIESEYLYDYFKENSWEIDWYSLLNGEFVDSVEVNVNSIALSVNDYEPVMEVKETEKYIISWVHEWKNKVRRKLSEET